MRNRHLFKILIWIMILLNAIIRLINTFSTQFINLTEPFFRYKLCFCLMMKPTMIFSMGKLELSFNKSVLKFSCKKLSQLFQNLKTLRVLQYTQQWRFKNKNSQKLQNFYKHALKVLLIKSKRSFKLEQKIHQMNRQKGKK